MIEYLDWDSHFFQKKMFRVSIDVKAIPVDSFKEIANNLKKINADCAYIVLSEKSESWENYLFAIGINCLDEKVLFEKNIVISESIQRNENISFFRGNKINDLIRLSKEAGKFSRFKIDEKLKYKFDLLYTEWVQKSVTGVLADVVIVYSLENEVKGFITGKVEKNIANIGLIAVDPVLQGKGIGKLLLDFAESTFISIGVNKIEVATQNANRQAVRFYENSRYTIKSINPIFHFWI